jgi:hypothetical protein
MRPPPFSPPLLENLLPTIPPLPFCTTPIRDDCFRCPAAPDDDRGQRPQQQQQQQPRPLRSGESVHLLYICLPQVPPAAEVLWRRGAARARTPPKKTIVRRRPPTTPAPTPALRPSCTTPHASPSPPTPHITSRVTERRRLHQALAVFSFFSLEIPSLDTVFHTKAAPFFSPGPTKARGAEERESASGRGARGSDGPPFFWAGARPPPRHPPLFSPRWPKRSLFFFCTSGH